MASVLDDLDSKVFQRDGYVVWRGFVPTERCDALRASVKAMLDPLLGPAELEADVGYPGAPASRTAPGGLTPRRLLHALSRDSRVRDWALDPGAAARLRRLTGTHALCVSQSHHNCVMTKHPGYGSATLWHQDVRYWSFDRPELVTSWLALGRERPENGALTVIPGSHLLDLDRGRLDRDLFLRGDLEENQALIARAVTIELEPGDVLAFHCRLFHAAGRNRGSEVKLSVVFTYHAADNHPIPGTRSAQYPSIPLPL